MTSLDVPAPEVAAADAQVGDTIWDGLAVSRITGEGKLGSLGPVWKVQCVIPFNGQESLVLKDAVLSVMPRREPA